MSRHVFALYSIVYFVAMSAMAMVGYLYGELSNGLASPSESGPFFCDELLSSGGDDSAMVISFILFSIPLAYRLVRFRRRPSLLELLVFGFCASVVLFSLWLATLDCAHILYTAFVVPDPFLAAALIGLPVSISTLWLLKRQS